MSVRAVVSSPAAMLTVCNICFRTTASNVVQPNWSSISRVRGNNKSSTESAYAVSKYRRKALQKPQSQALQSSANRCVFSNSHKSKRVSHKYVSGNGLPGPIFDTARLVAILEKSSPSRVWPGPARFQPILEVLYCVREKETKMFPLIYHINSGDSSEIWYRVS